MSFEQSDTQRDTGGDLTTELDAIGLLHATEIGRGGFGIVYRCSQAGLDRDVAVKVLTTMREQDRQRFTREQRAMGRLTGHPNIVAVLHVAETESGYRLLVMPYYPRGSLQDRIRRLGTLPAEEVLGLGVKLAGALASAHRLEIIHRDVKPANILFNDYGEPALTDFGIARIIGAFHTATGIFTGSPAYTAPEVLSGDAPTESSDVYGLGATLFSALTGTAPFERRQGEQVVAQFLRIAADPLPNLRARGIDDDIASVVEHAMARDPGARPTAQQLGETMQQLQQAHGLIVDAVPVPRETRAEPVPDRSAWLSPSRSVGNLPAPLSTCVGRELEVNHVRGFLKTSRLVTLAGPGGVGKTTLALASALELVRTFSDGVWFVELGDVHDDELLSDAVAAALGLVDQPGRPRSELLADFLRDREALLVLDNCEQLIDSTANLVETLLRNCPRIRVLSTSRETLNVGGESVLAVKPLAYPDGAAANASGALLNYPAVQLFVERTQAVLPDFAVTDADAEAIGQICARLDGLPLAIELAAARMRAMSAQQIADGLDARYQLLTRNRRGAPPRQQSLDCCLQWSYDLCTPDEQRVWAQLSVFAFSFDLKAAFDICAGEGRVGDLFDVLCRLVDKSILTRLEHGGVVRFRLLETVRAYGQSRLTDDEHRHLRRRHARWYQQLMTDAEPQWFTDQQTALIQRVDCEMPNIREALQYLLTMDPRQALVMTASMRPMWIIRGTVGEGRRWLDAALSTNDPQPTPERVRALRAAAQIAVVFGDVPGAMERVEQVRSAVAALPDPGVGAEMNLIEGYSALLSGDVKRARSLCRTASEATDDIETQSVALSVLGWIAEACGDQAAASDLLEKALALTEPLGESHLRAKALTAVGSNSLYRGDLQRAEKLLKDALRHTAAVNDRWGGEQCLQMLAWIAALNDNLHQFAVLSAASSALRQSTGAAHVLEAHRYIPLVVAHAKAMQDHCESRARDSLGTAGFELACREGSSLDFAESVALALLESD